MQHEITQRGPLLDAKGQVKEPGWARSLIMDYDRNKIKAPKTRLKEWDYYAVLNDKFGIAFTIADNGYMGFISVTLFDFIAKNEVTKTLMTLFPMGKFNMPAGSDSGDVKYKQKGFTLYFENNLKTRILTVDIENFSDGRSLKGTFTLQKDPEHESMVIATPFQKPGHFYYNQKINNMRASGKIIFNGKIFDFEKRPSFGVLDWGRGVWTYQNTWYWGSASGELNGELFGFNIGYGFGDTSAATENMLFYKGKAHKLENVSFNIPDDSYMKPWTFTSSDKRFEMTFQPVLDRHSNANVLLIQSDQHQVFGYFSGKAVLDDGEELKLDRFFGFAEKVYNRW
ncbi:MAG: DUF2804 domain-containing protein [Candidatus Marinimicrobia bacterium]|nr:DUF2804 domain-containing protein [Candidatus Neomarinimicrobiota bacterium]